MKQAAYWKVTGYFCGSYSKYGHDLNDFVNISTGLPGFFHESYIYRGKLILIKKIESCNVASSSF